MSSPIDTLWKFYLDLKSYLKVIIDYFQIVTVFGGYSLFIQYVLESLDGCLGS